MLKKSRSPRTKKQTSITSLLAFLIGSFLLGIITLSFNEKWTSLLTSTTRFKAHSTKSLFSVSDTWQQFPGFKLLTTSDRKENLLLYKIISETNVTTFSSPLVIDNTLLGSSENIYSKDELVIGLNVVRENGEWLQIGANSFIPLYLYTEEIAKPLAIFVKALPRLETERFYSSLSFCFEETKECKLQNTIKKELQRIKRDKRLSKNLISNESTLDSSVNNFFTSKSSFEDKRQKTCERITSWARCVKYGYCAWKRLPNQEFCFLDVDYQMPDDLKTDQYDSSLDFEALEIDVADYNEEEEEEEDNDLSLFYKNIEIAFDNTAPNLNISDEEDTKKYFIYQPSSGINNQRQQLANALIICRLLNRICILPPAASHTNYFENYNKQPGNKLISQQIILNAKEISKICQITFIKQGQTLVSFVNKNMKKYGIKSWRVVDKDYRKYKVVKKWNEKDIKNKFLKVKRKFLFFSNHSMWASLEWKGMKYGYDDRKLVMSHMSYNDEIKKIARFLSNSLALSTTHSKLHSYANISDDNDEEKMEVHEGEEGYFDGFHAVHIRRGDKKSEANFFQVSHLPEWYIERLKLYVDTKEKENATLIGNGSNERKISRKLYIATDEKDRSYFKSFEKEGFEVFFWEDLDLNLLLPFLNKYPVRMFMDILSIIEQLICTYSSSFLGSGYSTLSVFVLRLRKHRTDIGYNTELGLPDGLPVYAQEDTKCNPFRPKDHTKPC